MTFPTWQDWAFSIKTTAAAILALYISMWVDLPRPYWAAATVYITSQVLVGATASKAIYRVIGTAVGVVVAVILVPNLVDAPVLLSGAIALWVGICLYFAMLDRSPRSYTLLLAGYTAALIGFPSVDAPGTIFDVAVARTEEITIGILCATLCSSLVLPRSAVPLIAQTLGQWLVAARGWVKEVLDRVCIPEETQVERLRLAAGALALDNLATPLRYDSASVNRSTQAMANLRQHMLMFLPIVSAISDRIIALDHADAVSKRLQNLLREMADWIASGTTETAVAEHLRSKVDKLEPRLSANPTWSQLVLASLVDRLRDFIDLRQDTRALQRHILHGDPAPTRLAFRYTARAREIRHRDQGLALLGALGAFLAILVACFIWIETAWPDGSSAPMMAAVGCCLFAAQDDPSQGILIFGKAAIIGTIGAGIYLFGLLPHATSFEMLALALAPGLIVVSLLMTQPRFALLGVGIGVLGTSAIALQESYSSDFSAFANASLALVIGTWIAVVVTRLVRVTGVSWAVNRLRRSNRQNLVEAARRQEHDEPLALAALMLDRLGLIAGRLARLSPAEAASTAQLLAEVRVGINLVELVRAEHVLSGEARDAMDALLDALARHYRTDIDLPPPELLPVIDRSLDTALATDVSSESHRTALLGLVGLRRALFPDGPVFHCSPTRAPAPEVAA